MQRDFETYKKWEKFHGQLQYEEFEKKKSRAIESAQSLICNSLDDASKRSAKGLLQKSYKMIFQFDRSNLINYGHCLKFDKPVSFLPQVCQIETQHCFVHRKDLQ